MKHDEDSTPKEMLEEDWTAFAKEYSQRGVQISKSPDKELSNGQVESIHDAYRTSRDAGEQRVREVLKGILEGRKKSIDQSLDSLEKAFEDAELRNASQRKKPLSEEAGRKASQLGSNIDLLKEYLSVTFEDLAAVSGLSRSSLHKIARKGRIPKITTLYKLGIGLGVHPEILRAGTDTLRGLDQLADVSYLQSSTGPEKLEDTTGEMDDVLYGDPDEGSDPGHWLTIVEDITVKIVEYYKSNGGILGAVIGRHHGGRYGAFLAAHAAHRMRKELTHEDLGGFRFPSQFIWGRIKRRLREGGAAV